MTKEDIEEQLKYNMTELIDEYFPKGDKGRGRAIMIMALLLSEALSLFSEEKVNKK